MLAPHVRDSRAKVKVLEQQRAREQLQEKQQPGESGLRLRGCTQLFCVCAEETPAVTHSLATPAHYLYTSHTARPQTYRKNEQMIVTELTYDSFFTVHVCICCYFLRPCLCVCDYAGVCVLSRPQNYAETHNTLLSVHFTHR